MACAYDMQPPRTCPTHIERRPTDRSSDPTLDRAESGVPAAASLCLRHPLRPELGEVQRCRCGGGFACGMVESNHVPRFRGVGNVLNVLPGSAIPGTV